MNYYLSPRRIIVTLAALAVLGIAVPSLASEKFDARLSSAARKAGLDKMQDGSYKALRAPDSIELVKILVRFSDNKALDAIRSDGGIVNSVLGNIASVEISASALGSLAAVPEIQYMEAEKVIPARLNFSVPSTRANLLRSGVSPDLTGANGAGVIVGVVDDGLDFRHLDFRNADGSTRLLGLWDQRTSGAAGSPPAGFSYGGECTIKMLNDAINGADGCSQPSTGNHGTHVGGIAAGNGQQTGNGQAAYRFVGMAPKADILAANSIAGGTGGNAVVDAISWMKTKAAALGKPLVVNLSLGSYFGARDGTSNFEQALSNASAAGVIITAAAGNEGSDKIVATGQISAGQTKSVTFNWANSVNDGQQIEIWYPGTNQYAVKLTGPGACAMPEFVAAGASKTFTLPCGTIEVTSTAPQANNDDRQILVSFAVNRDNPTGLLGDWTYELRGDVVAAPNTNFSLICGETGNGLLFTSNTPTGFTLGILTDTASATRTIAVASYNTNYSWATTGGAPNLTANYDHGPLTDISIFSSRGPRRNCSNPAKCPAVMKPEIAAPGAMIMSALGQDAKRPTNDSIEADGKHVAYNGTSMATPHLTGAVALMLQKNPSLTPEQVKQILFQHVQTNGFTTALPSFNPASPLMPATTNDNWGYGMLDAQAAYNAVSGGSSSASYSGLWWNASESGWGISLTQRGSIIFMAWYTYDQSGAPVWYVMSNCAVSGAGCTGDIYAVTGGKSPTVPWSGTGIAVSKAGSGTFAFSDANNGSLNYSLNGVSGIKSITRQIFANGATPPAVDYTALWWNASESGWGVSLTQQFGTIFVALYTYDASGKPIWYVASNCPVVGSGCSGPLYQVTNGSVPTSPWNGANLAVKEVGTISFAFSDGSNGTMSYTINGAAGSKIITRQLF
jgi:subtilisin family serine protease